jgi:hypothetical protein
MARLARGAESDQIESVDTPPGLGEDGGIATPVAAAGSESVHQHQGGMMAFPQLPPVTVVALPGPQPMLPPVRVCWAMDGSKAGWWAVLSTKVLATADSSHYCEGLARLLPGHGFFRPDSRPARDLGVLLARSLASEGPLTVLDLMAGCGIRSLRYGLEAGAVEVWANDADPERVPLIRHNLAPCRRGRLAVVEPGRPGSAGGDPAIQAALRPGGSGCLRISSCTGAPGPGGGGPGGGSLPHQQRWPCRHGP